MKHQKKKGEYLDVYEGVCSEILYTAKFDEYSDLGTAYLCRIDMIRSDKLRAEKSFQYQRRAIQ